MRSDAGYPKDIHQLKLGTLFVIGTARWIRDQLGSWWFLLDVLRA